MRRRRLGLLGVVLSLFIAAPAFAAPRTYAVGAEVRGAVTARFTLRHTVRFPLDIRVTRPSDVYGMILTRVGDSYGFFVGLKVAPIQPGGFGAIGSPVEDAGLTWRPGTYDLTLFSTAQTRVTLSFENPMPHMTFRPRTLQLVKRVSTSSAPAWTDQVDLTISGATHGLFVSQRDEWNGMYRHMEKSCVWHPAPCLPVDGEQFTEGKNDSGSHLAERFAATAGAVFAQGANHVSIASIVGGTATRRTAVVLVVP